MEATVHQLAPLFLHGAYNREGKKMKVVFFKEVTDGTDTYRLWHKAGKPDNPLTYEENDQYYLYVEQKNRLISIGATERFLVKQCGYKAAVQERYGSAEQHQAFIHKVNQEHGLGSETANRILSDELKKLNEEIVLQGSSPALWTAYIRRELQEHITLFQKAKADLGKSFPDFIGAFLMDDLDCALSLKAIREKRSEEKREQQKREIAERNRNRTTEGNTLAEQQKNAALRILREGGVLKNDTIRVFKLTDSGDDYDIYSYCMVNYLLRLYGLQPPFRTQGWISEKLISVTIREGQCCLIRFSGKKNSKCPTSIMSSMNRLIAAVKENSKAA